MLPPLLVTLIAHTVLSLSAASVPVLMPMIAGADAADEAPKRWSAKLNGGGGAAALEGFVTSSWQQAHHQHTNDQHDEQ